MLKHFLKMPPKTDATNTSPSTSASTSTPTIQFTPEQMGGILSASIKAQIHKVNIGSLDTNIEDKFDLTKHVLEFVKHFERKLLTLGFRTPEEKASILLNSIGKEAAFLYDAASDIVTTGNAYEQAVKKLKTLFCLPDPEKQARVLFYSVKLDSDNEKPLVLLEKLRKAAVLCGFEHPDQEIMRVLLNKCPDSKFQEKATLADWDETKLAEAEKFSRNLEQSHLTLRKIKSSYGGRRVNKVQACTSCKTCGRFHDVATPCPAKG